MGKMISQKERLFYHFNLHIIYIINKCLTLPFMHTINSYPRYAHTHTHTHTHTQTPSNTYMQCKIFHIYSIIIKNYIHVIYPIKFDLIFYCSNSFNTGEKEDFGLCSPMLKRKLPNIPD